MSRLSTLAHASWADPAPPTLAADATVALESGSVLFLPNLRFGVDRDEQAIFSPSILASSKNTSFDPVTGRVGGTRLAGDEQAHLARIMARFSDSAHTLINGSVSAISRPFDSGSRELQAGRNRRPADVLAEG